MPFAVTCTVSGSLLPPALKAMPLASPSSSALGDCIDSDNTVEGAVPAIGVDGRVHVGAFVNNTFGRHGHSRRAGAAHPRCGDADDPRAAEHLDRLGLARRITARTRAASSSGWKGLAT